MNFDRVPNTSEHLERRFRQLGLNSEKYMKREKTMTTIFYEKLLYRKINVNIVYSLTWLFE